MDPAKKCAATDCKNFGGLTCAKCKTTRYCSTECQMKMWQTHQAECQQVDESSRDNSIAMANGNPKYKYAYGDKSTLKSQQQYDVCMVFPSDPRTGAFSEKSEDEILKKIIPVVGLDNVHMYFSVDRGEIIVLIRLSDDSTRFYCDLKQFALLSDSAELSKRSKLGWNEHNVAPLPIIDTDIEEITRYHPFEHIYLKFELEEEFESLYKKDPITGTNFSHILKLKVLNRIMTEPKDENGLEFQFNKYKLKPKGEEIPLLLQVFPLHEKESLKIIKSFIFTWQYFYPWDHPFNPLRDYFGEKVTLYYKFMGHFTFWLVGPAVIGLAFEIIVAVTQNPAYQAIPFYSLFTVIWGVVMLEFWKRKERFTALEWGMLYYEGNEPVRAEFTDYEKINLTGEETLYFNENKKRKLVFESFGIIILLCVCVVATTTGIYVMRWYVATTNKAGSEASAIVASILNAIQIQIYTYIYSGLSDYLTDRENHKTDTEYEDSMIAKNFLFAFINSYVSFFFIAFIAEKIPKPTYPGEPVNSNVGMCGYPTCMTALAVNLGIVLAANIAVNNTVGIILPLFTFWNNQREEMKRNNTGIDFSDAEKQFCMTSFDFKSVINDYLMAALQFGYMTMFVSALPGAALIVLIALWIESKADLWRMTNIIQRPWPTGAEDIGSWQDIFDFIVTAAIVTNAALIVFTMNVLDGYDEYFQFWIFIGFQWVMFVVQYVIRAMIPDDPFEVALQAERQEHFNKKLITREPDEDLKPQGLSLEELRSPELDLNKMIAPRYF